MAWPATILKFANSRHEWLQVFEKALRPAGFSLRRTDPEKSKPSCAHVNMQKLWWPGYEMQLIDGLQKQQNTTQFCDTLLQTEGISVPAHSCILAALSPYLSQRLSSVPSSQPEQRRQVQLQSVPAQTLLKIVSILYSGELEVEGNKEQNEVLAAARQFGIADLVLGQRRELLNSRRPKLQDAQVQTVMCGSNVNFICVEKKSYASVDTQTTAVSVTSVEYRGIPPDQTTPETQNHSFTCSDTPSAGYLSSTKSTPPSSLSSKTTACFAPTCNKDLSICGRLWGENVPDVSECCDNSVALTNINPALKDTGVHESTGDDRNINVDISGDSKEKRMSCARTLGKNLERVRRMQQMDETTRSTFKMKLRRRTRGKPWEVINVQDTDETELILEDCSTPKTSEFCPKTVQIPVTSPPSAQHSESQRLHSKTQTSACLSKDGSISLEPEELPQPQASVEETEEQIDKLLEEVMMGLIFLPSLGNDLSPCASYSEGQNLPSAISVSAEQPDIQIQPQSEFSLPVKPSVESDEMISHDRENSLHPQTTEVTLPPTLCSSGKKLEQQPSQEGQQILDGLSPSSQNSQILLEQGFPLPCGKDLRLPPPLSPLEPWIPEALQEPPSYSSQNEVQLKSHSCLSEAPSSLHIPVSTVEKNPSLSPSLKESGSLGSVQLQQDTKSNSEKESVCEECPSAKRTVDPKNSEMDLEHVDKIRKRRKDMKGLQDSHDLFLRCKKMKVCDRATTHCSVSMMSNNVLATEMKKAANPINIPKTMSNVPAPITSKVKRKGIISTRKTPVRTRGFLKKSQECTSVEAKDSFALVPMMHRSGIRDDQDTSGVKRKHGRSHQSEKAFLTRLVKSDNGKKTCEKSVEKHLPEEQKGKRSKKSCRKARKKIRKKDTDNQKKTCVAEVSGNNKEEDGKKTICTRKPSLAATLKEFQKLINQKRSKTTNSTEKRKQTTVEIKPPLSSSPEAPDDELHQGMSDGSRSLLSGSEGKTVASSEISRERFKMAVKSEQTLEDLNKGQGATVLEMKEKFSGGRKDVCHSSSSSSSETNGRVTSSPAREEEEDNEVDIMFCSPENPLLPREFKEGLKTVVLPPDDDDDDDDDDYDVNIDVIGD